MNSKMMLLFLAVLAFGLVTACAANQTGEPTLPTPTAVTFQVSEATPIPSDDVTPTAEAAPSANSSTATPGGEPAPLVPTAAVTKTPHTPAATIPLCSGPQLPLITDLQVRSVPVLPEPAPRAAFRDPTFGTCIVRVTDRKADIDSDDESKGIKTEYSRVQALNADGSRLLLRGTAATWYLYDAATLKRIQRISAEIDPRWDARDPNVLYWTEFTTDEHGPRLMRYDLTQNQATVLHDFSKDIPGPVAAVWMEYEGSPSVDGRYWGLMAEDPDWKLTDILVYDQQTDRVIGRRDMRGKDLDANVVTMSPLGDYVVADFGDTICPEGKLGTDTSPCGLMIYDRTVQRGRGLLPIVGHSDLALDSTGRQVLVFQDVQKDSLSMVDLASGQVTPLWKIDFSRAEHGFHISGRALNRPGWAVVSAYNGGRPASVTWMDDQVFLMEVKPGGRILRLAHHHTVYNSGVEHDYWAEPHATPNRDLTRILFTSNWGRTGTDEVDVYMIDLSGGME